MSKQYPLDVVRHSASHVMAQAVTQLFPGAKLGIGPAIEDGYYYDFDIDKSLTPEDLETIERRMEDIIKEDQSFSQFSLDKDKAVQLLMKKEQPFKLELIKDLDLSEYSFFENGPFLDLCRGPHVEKTSQIGCIKLLKVSGAYWRGSEKNKMLQRIYGTAFNSKKELKSYLHRLEEAKKRDHRLIGKTLDLFSISEDVGGGLIQWHPKGAIIRHIMESYWKETHIKAGYQLLYTPHIGKAELWKTSGHLDFYDENMYSPIKVDEQDYFVRPMNCPFHVLIYKNKLKSYRELPIRYAELGTVYRYERSGVLHGLLRVRGFTQDDAHIICTPEQMESEIKNVMTFSLDMLKAFGFSDVKIYLSTRPEKYVGEVNQWDSAEKALQKAIDELSLSYNVDEGGGAFYGPKIDIKIKDAIGREWQCSTVQFDFNLPQRFDMSYVGNDGEKHRPYMIHRAILGSLERFFGILIEHYEGKFPVWLAPVQVKILNVTDTISDYSIEVKDTLVREGFRVELNDSSDKIGYKIRQGVQERVPYLIILGKKEAENNTVSVRKLGGGDLGSLPIASFIETIKAENIPLSN